MKRDRMESENERLQFLEESYETLIQLLLGEDEVEKDLS